MKHFILTLFIGICAGAYGQVDFDERLLAKFSEERITELAVSNPEIIAYWVYYLDHSYTITSLPSGKSINGVQTVRIKDVSDFNILALDVHMNRHTPNYYSIKGSNKILVMLSNSDFSEKFNVHRGLR